MTFLFYGKQHVFFYSRQEQIFCGDAGIGERGGGSCPPVKIKSG
jgi:hypothetical protein